MSAGGEEPIENGRRAIRTPDSLAVLVDFGIVQEVVRPLMSGKEAQIYLVVSEGQERVAKVYKEAQERTFKHRAEYTEGRKTRNSRDQRAINKRSRHGRKQDEAAWRTAEVDMIYRLRDAGVRVPEPFHFVDGVLVMELIKDGEGDPAPRLGDISLGPREAVAVYDALIAEVVRMLCAGVVHGDLSEFNVLMAADGPVVIDFPQSVDPASNQNARRLLLRDVANLHRFVARLAPGTRRPLYAEEMWELYKSNRLTPTTRLGGNYKPPAVKTDTREVLDLIADADQDERARRGANGEGADDEEEREAPTSKPLRRVVDLTPSAPSSRKRAGASGGGAQTGDREPRSAPTARKKSTRRRSRTRSSSTDPAKDSSRREDGAPRGRSTRSAAGTRGAAGPRREGAAEEGARSTSTAPAGAKKSRRRRRGRSKKPGPAATGRDKGAAQDTKASTDGPPRKKRARRRRRPGGGPTGRDR
jgi:RIO kinase 1